MSLPDPEFIEVFGHRMAYHEMGDGDPIVFQHGNPTSSYLWRNIMPHCADLGRCIAVDLIGMGASDKLTETGRDAYNFATHQKFLDAAWQALGITSNVTLVLHDWGTALGFDWARRHPGSVRAIAHMEGIVDPVPSWDDWPTAATPIFQAMRGPAGEEIVLRKNVFVERILPSAVLSGISDADMEVYRAPFARVGEDRRPTLSWPRHIPIAGQPPDMVALVERYAAWLAGSELPKLFVNAEPGSILTGPMREACRRWPNQTEVTVRGAHFIQEDSPAEITAALRDFIGRL